MTDMMTMMTVAITMMTIMTMATHPPPFKLPALRAGRGADENDGEKCGDRGDDDDDDRDDDDDDNGDGDDDDGTARATLPFKILELRAGLVEGES